MRRQIGACGTVAACLLFLPLPAVAQQDAQAEDEKLPQFTEEITVRVTARKREENLQSVPFSVAAPTPQVLRTRGAESLEDVSVNVAGFSVQNLESPDLKVGRSSANRHNLRGASSPSVSE